MPIISNTMLEAPIPININVNNIFDEYDENFKPRRKESKFLKYLLTSNRLQFTNNTTDEIDNVSNNNTTTITNNNIKNTMTSDNVSIQQQPTIIESTQQQQQQELSELNKKRRKRIIENESELTIADIDDSFEVNQEVDSDENERATTPEPLARKEIKRRKTIDFLFQDVPYSYHPQPYSYVYPHIAPQQNTKNTWLPIMRSMSMSTLPIPTTNSSSSSVGSSATTSPSLSPINSRKKKIMSTSYPLIPISERQQEQQLLALSTPITPLTTPRKTPSRMLQQMKRESEEAEITSNNSNNNNSNTSFDGDMKLSELAESFQSPVAAPPPVPRRKMSETGLEGDMTPQGQNDTNFAERIIECLKSIGGKATGAEITQWISSNYDDVLSTKKKLGYTVNAVLSSKKHQNVFAKESVIIDGNKRAMWKLIDELADKSKLPNNNNNNTITPSTTTTNSANISSHKLEKKSRSKLDLYDENDIPDESSTDPYGPEHLSDDEIDKDEDWIDEGSARRKKLLQSMSPSAYDLQRYINFEKTTGDLSLNSEIKEDQEMSLKTSKVLEEQGSQMVNVLETTIETTEMHPTIKEQNLPFLSAINMGDQSVTQNSEINTDDLLSNEVSVLDTGKFNEISNEIVATSSVTKKGRPPLSRRRKAGSFHDEASNEAWTPSDLKDDEMDMKDIEEDDDEEEEIYNKYNNNNSKITNNNNNIINNNNNITSESSGESSGSDVEDSKDSMLDKEIKVSEDEHNDELKIEEEKKPITTTTKRGVGRPRGTTSGSTPRARVSKRAKGDEEIFDFDDNDLEEFEYDEKLLSKSKRQENNDEEDGKKSRRKSKGKRSRKGRKKREEGEDLQGESETDQKYDEPDELEGSTYTEMIIHALRALGGRGTGTEITTFIDENYSDILQTKTSTWKNSVMGCLSANRRNVFSKEPVKEYAKRYVWVLNEAKNTHQGPESDKKIKRKKKEKSDDVMNSSSDSLKDGVTQNDWVEPIVLPEKPVVNEESKDYDMDLEAIFEDDFENEDLDDGSEDDYDGSNKKHQNTNIAPTFNSVRKGRCDNAVELITEALRDMGGSATGIQITEWLAVHYKDLADDRKKLGYTVNAVLSSKKYRGRFVKEKMVQGGGSARALWRLGAPSGGRNKGRTSH